MTLCVTELLRLWTGASFPARQSRLMPSKSFVRGNVVSKQSVRDAAVPVPVPVPVSFLNRVTNLTELITFGPWEYLCLTKFQSITYCQSRDREVPYTSIS